MSLRTAIVRLQLPNRFVASVTTTPTTTTRHLATGVAKRPGSSSFVSPKLLKGWYNV